MIKYLAIRDSKKSFIISIAGRSSKLKTPAKVDRLSEDKEYLALLANGIGRRHDVQDDGTNKMVRATANQALDFLKARENFWDQLDLGQDHRKAKASSLKALQSYRWIM